MLLIHGMVPHDHNLPLIEVDLKARHDLKLEEKELEIIIISRSDPSTIIMVTPAYWRWETIANMP